MSRPGGFAAKIKHSSALSSTLGNRDLRTLQDLINAEKSVVSSLQKLSVDLSRSSEALKLWGTGEGDDLGDVLTHSASMMSHVSNALSVYASHEQTLREHMKSIRTREELLDSKRNTRKNVGKQADSAEKKLSKMGSENKNLATQTELFNKLREEIRQLDSEIMTEEAEIGDFKRRTTKAIMSLKLGGLLEFAEKATIVGELGKLLIEEVPLDTTTPGQSRALYMGREKTEKLEQEVSRCVGEVVFSGNTSAIPPPNRANLDTSLDSDRGGLSGLQYEELPYTLPPVRAAEHQQSNFVGGFTPQAADVSVPDGDRSQFSAWPTADDTMAAQQNNQHYSDQSTTNARFATFPVNRRAGEQTAPFADQDNTGFVHNESQEETDHRALTSDADVWEAERQPRDFHHNNGEQPHRVVHFMPTGQEEIITQSEANSEPNLSTSMPGPPFSIQRVPPPRAPESEGDDEESRNMAAAREVSREMDKLSFNPPIERQPSPLAPPAPPFATRSVSPIPGSQPLREASSIPPSPTRMQPPAIHIPARDRAGSQASLNRLDASPRGEGPMPPLGARTISASAFKRGPGRGVGTGSDNENSEALSPGLRKRSLPTSPYPVYRAASGGSFKAMEGDRGVPFSRTHEAVDSPGGIMGTGTPTDLPPSYMSSDGHEAGPGGGDSSPRQDYGRLGQVRIANPDGGY